MPVLFLFFSLSVFLFMVVYAFSDEGEWYRSIAVSIRNIDIRGEMATAAVKVQEEDLRAQDKKTESTFRVVRRELETVLGRTEVLERTLTNMQLPKQRKRT